jgi:NAD(P)H-hydrate epimerase
MRSGAGLLTTHAPEIVANVIRNSLPEAMLSLDSDPEYFSVLPDLSSYNAIGIGPGIGTNEVSVNAVKLLIQNYKQAIVMDADALNILGENKTWLGFLTPGTILTPHPREFERIAGKSYHSYERIQKQIEMSKRFGIFIILKGAHSTLSCPDGSLYFNNTGNPGMATAGTGDVLTGIILGLLSQGYSAHNSAVLGMYIHGLAGDLALENESIESLIASDIIDNIGSAFNYLRHGDYEQNITK